MGSIAAAFDPALKFRIGGEKVDVVRRRRTRETGSYQAGVEAIQVDQNYRNYINHGDLPPEIVGEFLHDTSSEDVGNQLPAYDTTHTTFVEDSTNRLRAKGTFYNEYESCRVHDLDWSKGPSEPIVVTEDIIENGELGRIDRTHRVTTISYPFDGPLAPIVQNFGFDSALEGLNENVKQFCADHLEDFLPQCLSNRRLFNAFYQIGELKDLPMMIEKTLATSKFLRNLAKDPVHALTYIDKASGDAYLNWEFGYKSLQQVVKSLVNLPEKVAKRFNYLLRKNSKRAAQRFSLTYKNVDELGQLWPSWTYILPATVEYEILEETVDFRPDVEIRCVVDSTINFPELAVPKFSDSTYRDLLGLNPTISDVYNLIPWTWLGDWFVGVSKYLNMIERITNDKDLINVGFVTVILHSNLVLKGKVRVYTTRSVTYNSDGDVTSESHSDPVDIPYQTSGSMDYRCRFSIDELFGVKSVSDKQGLLDSDQKSILGALLTKFT
jgi:hypothetical protein